MNAGFGQELDQVTLARARRGDMQAFGQIYRLYGRASYNLALRVLGDPSVAEDVVQDVFLKLMGNVNGYRGDAPFGAWLKRLTANATIDVLRSNRRYALDVDSAQVEAVSSPEAAADVAIDAWSLLQQLPPRTRAVLVLHQLEGYTHKELAELLGHSESYSKSILSRALQRLHQVATQMPTDTSEP